MTVTRVKTSQGWLDLQLPGPAGPAGAPGAAGPAGPPGDPGKGWVALTQAEYDALAPPDPDTLYLIVG
jgi:hypothetical protein